MSGEDEAEKEHDPTQKRLDEARARGEIARSTDLMAAAGYGGLLLACAAFGVQAMLAVGAVAKGMLDQSDRLSIVMADGGRAGLGPVLGAFAQPLMPLFLFPGAVVLVYLFATRGLIFAPEKLMPKLSRISPLATAKQKFGIEGLFEFGKSAVKMGIVSAVLYVFLQQRGVGLLNSIYLTPAMSTALLLRLLVDFILLVFLVAVVIGGADFLWQKFSHLRRNRMSRKDLMDEMKESEGDPHMRAQRRQRAQEVANNRMLQDVATADVVVVNPTHYAVALKWKRGSRTAPICVAKGVDEVAARIRERAVLAGVPVQSDPPTARAVYASVKIGQQIKPEHYRAVAAAIRFAEAMRGRARKSWTGA
jgi:flagellar biosynthesis protein FlhB